jgi:MFS family permease
MPDLRKMSAHHWLLLITLYFLQGFPSGLLVHAMPALLRSSGVSLELIGLLKLLALPWVLRFIWAPYVDRFYVRKWGAHRSWILMMQGLVVLSVLLLMFTDIGSLSRIDLLLIFSLIFLINLFCATQDIATDALAVKLLPSQLRGLGNSVQVSGYKIGLLFGGNAILWGLDLIGWQISLLIMAMIILLCLLPTLLFNENQTFPDIPFQTRPVHVEEPVTFSWYWQQFMTFAQRPGVGFWLFTLGLYKVGDSLGSAMIKPMLVDIGTSLSTIANLSLIGSLAGIIAATIGGLIYFRTGPRTCLLLFGILQGLGLGAYAMVNADSSFTFLAVLSIFEQSADGMATVALFAMMMEHCRKDHEGTDYSLQACIQVSVAGIGGVLAGLVANLFGYATLFTSAMLLTWLCLMPVMLLFRKDQYAARAERTFT